MRYYFILLVVIGFASLSPAVVLGQTEEVTSSPELAEIIDFVQKMPVLLVKIDPQDNLTDKQQRDATLLRFVYSHFRNVRPDLCGISGTLVVQFTITKEGRIDPGTINCIRSLHPDFGAEAVRVVHLMAELGWRWQPASFAGQPVDVLYTLPIRVGLR
ncbi:MAG: energy transducer TonB [Bacteroidota bacterium]